MSQKLTVPVDVSVIRIPEERIITMMKTCAQQIEQVNSIEDAKECTSAAEAINAIARKVDVAKEIKKSAVRLLVSAEAKLGKLLSEMPVRTKPGKVEILANFGINRQRTNLAQRLSRIPQERIDKVIDAGAQTLHGVTSKLGLLSSTYDLRERKLSAYTMIAEEAVTLLQTCVKRNQVPHAGTVAHMVKWMENVKAHGNLK